MPNGTQHIKSPRAKKKDCSPRWGRGKRKKRSALCRKTGRREGPVRRRKPLVKRVLSRGRKKKLAKNEGESSVLSEEMKVRGVAGKKVREKEKRNLLGTSEGKKGKGAYKSLDGINMESSGAVSAQVPERTANRTKGGKATIFLKQQHQKISRLKRKTNPNRGEKEI